MTIKDVAMERVFPSGGWLASAIVDGHLIWWRYFGYTKREAARLFVQEINAR